MSIRIRLHRLGRHQGTNDIEPSAGVMDILDQGAVKYRLVTDFGTIPKNDSIAAKRSFSGPEMSLFDDGIKVDAVQITHVHGDHVGFLPAIVPYLKPNARIFMTRPSAAMVEPIFADSLRINEMRGGSLPFNKHQLVEALNRISIIYQPGEIEMLSGLREYVHPEGHINGACSFTTRVGKLNIHYSGDRCTHDQPGIRGAELLPKAWWPNIVAGSDCTYGADPDSDLRHWPLEVEHGFDLARETLRHGSPALFFCFSIHRGGSIAHELERLGLHKVGKIFLDGGCRRFTKIAQSIEGHWSNCDTPLIINQVRTVNHPRDRDKILIYKKAAIIATPGMGGPGGIGTWWRRQIMPNPDAAMIFTGYVAPGTDGEKILQGAAERALTGKIPHLTFTVEDEDGQPYTEIIPLRCKVLQIRAGGHSPRLEILEWFKIYNPEVAVLNHGSSAALASIEQSLRGDIKHLIRSDLQSMVELDI